LVDRSQVFDYYLITTNLPQKYILLVSIV